MPDNSCDRRTILKRTLAGGAAIAGLSGTTLASGPDRFEQMKRDILVAERIGWQSGEKAKARFLDERGYKHASRTIEVPLVLGGEDDEDTVDVEKIQDPQDGGIKATMGGYYDTYENYYSASLSTDYWFKATCTYTNVGYFNKSHGSPPKDAAALRWNPPWAEYWRLADGGGESATFSSTHSSWDEDVHEPGIGRTGFKFDDSGVYDEWKDTLPDCGYLDSITEEEYVRAGTVGVMLTPTGDHSYSDRRVWGSYTHSWSDIRLSVTPNWSTGGWSLTFSPYIDVDEAIINTNPDGNDLVITQDEILDTKFP
ncbi:hypothetical protein [Salinilacihabitans rarus]|uniref:hypothetical protein n=1 Tax=Salinilacihabitans rarus TaxID=2961596 RepID=UPI0020C852A7|nr:hypothetical protein [Salinilacihabitans rarus]